MLLGGPFYASDLESEQEGSRPSAYVSRRSGDERPIIGVEDPANARGTARLPTPRNTLNKSSSGR